jgi:hypothetical protein
MGDRYLITIRIEPVHESTVRVADAKSPGDSVAFDVPRDPTQAHVRVTQGAERKDDVRLQVEVTAETDQEAEQRARELAQQFVRVEALAEDAIIHIPSFRSAGVHNLSQPDRLYPRDTFQVTLYHHAGAGVEQTWARLASIPDAHLRTALDVVLDWLYIGSLATDARTAFLTYWTALEYLLKLGHGKPQPRPLPTWLREGKKRMTALGVAVTDAQLDAFRLARNELVHEAGAGPLGPSVSESFANSLRSVLADYVKALLASPSTVL